MNEQQCECSEDYGPCEDHCTVLAQREGASCRTADELAFVFLCDAEDILRSNSGGAPDADRVRAMLNEYSDAEWSRPDVCGWLEDADVAQALHDDVNMVESWLSAWTLWDDGYSIVVPTGDCPLLDSSS